MQGPGRDRRGDQCRQCREACLCRGRYPGSRQFCLQKRGFPGHDPRSKGKDTIMKQLDLLIIGGGPIGIACGLEAKKAKLDYLIIEKGPIVNSLFNYPINMQFFSSSEKLEIDGIPFISNEAKPKRNEALEYYRRIVTSNELDIHLF